MKVEFYKHSLSEKDIDNTINVLRSVFLTTGPACAEFEELFSSFSGLKHTVALSSCTAAMQLALTALGIGPGCEVITTPMTFIATATAILHAGATPVFVDIEEGTGLMDPNLVEAAITSKTKAILPVHLYGTMADIISLRALADQYNLYIIEDAAHCIEGERDGVRPGQLSDAVCYSFYATKNLTCGEGGALASNNRELAEKVRLLRQHGMTKEAADRYHGLYKHWDMVELGWKYNLDDVRAALLINQLDRLPSLWKNRCHLYKKYSDHFQNHEFVTIPQLRGKSAHHLFTIQVASKNRDFLLEYMGNHGVGAAVNYRAVHSLTWFRKKFGFHSSDFPKANTFGQRTLSLPFYPGLADDAIDTVIITVENGIKNCK